MAKFSIQGGKKLAGEIEVMGSKNAALKIFPAVFLTSEPIVVSNLPEIEDCGRAQEMLIALGHSVNPVGESRSRINLLQSGQAPYGARKIGSRKIEIQFKNQKNIELPAILVNKFRASIMFVGPMLAKFGEVKFPHPGGCVIGAGTRPIDLFLDGFQKMGANLKVSDSHYHLFVKARGGLRKLRGAEIFFPKISVTATESLMMTACLAQGTTILKNAAMEPEIAALADFLNNIGAKISGAGTPTITIIGVKNLGGGEYKIIPDRIETGTFAMLAAAAGANGMAGEVFIKNSEPKHLEILWVFFDKIGVDYEIDKNGILIKPLKKMITNIIAQDVTTHEYPGFATDLQPPYTTLMTQARGISLIHETIYDRRLLFTDSLTQMGANIIMADPHRAIVQGPAKLSGKKLVSPDLRAGMALVMAGLIAQGATEIDNIYQIERGYEKIDERLRGLGADIKRF